MINIIILNLLYRFYYIDTLWNCIKTYLHTHYINKNLNLGQILDYDFE